MPLPNPVLISEIRRLNDGSRTYREIADAVSRSKAHVEEIVRSHNMPRPPHDNLNLRRRSPESERNVERIRNLCDGVLTSKEIGEIVGVSAKYVQRIMHDFDLPRPAQGGRMGILNPAFQGGRRIDLDGYAFVSAPVGHPFAPLLKGKKVPRIFEHRLVMERKLGRYLQPQEVVDHIDGLHLHNHPDNLRVFASNSDHLKATISGQIPNWSKAGLDRMRTTPDRRATLKPVDSYSDRRARGDVRLQQILLAWLLLGKDSQFLLGTHRWLDKSGIYDRSQTSLELHLQKLNLGSQ